MFFTHAFARYPAGEQDNINSSDAEETLEYKTFSKGNTRQQKGDELTNKNMMYQVSFFARSQMKDEDYIGFLVKKTLQSKTGGSSLCDSNIAKEDDDDKKVSHVSP